MTEDVCFVCQQSIEKTDSRQEFMKNKRTITVHVECIELFSDVVRYALQTYKTASIPIDGPDLTTLPIIQKEKDTEPNAILKLLQWSSTNHPGKGLLPREIDEIFKEQYRWVLSNSSARLGELIEQAKVRRTREGKTYRYFAN